MSCRESTQLSPTVMQRAALQAFLDLENIMSQDVKLSQLRFHICCVYILYADSTNDSTETDDAIEADDSASSVKIDLKHNFLAWQVSTCMCVTRDWIILYSCAVYTHA